MTPLPTHRSLKDSLARFCLSFTLLNFACRNAAPDQAIGSETNWLVHCDGDATCSSDLACVCGVCTETCSSDRACEKLGGTCASKGSGAQTILCESRSSDLGLCLPRCSDTEPCQEGMECKSGNCIWERGSTDDADASSSAAEVDSSSPLENLETPEPNPETQLQPGSGEPETPLDGGALTDGQSCTEGGQCVSGLCEGVGCGTNDGLCVPQFRTCQKDLAQYCGCDGLSFSASGNCANDRYQYRGACKNPELETPGTDAGPGKLSPEGASCDNNGECESGLCEGEGCEENDGTCVNPERPCTRDTRRYCGCDGKEFEGSSSCPGGRYSHEGSCEPVSGVGDGSEGSACDTGADCDSDICEGEGCGEAEGVCASAARACTTDLVEYCGCDGTPFSSSSGCPGRRFSSRGACDSPSECAAVGEFCIESPCCSDALCEGESSMCIPR